MVGMSFNLRGISSEIMMTLKQEAAKQHVSVNVLILKLIEHGIGHSYTVNRPTYHDLDKFAGTWSTEDAKEFEQNTSFFEKIDQDLWA